MASCSIKLFLISKQDADGEGTLMTDPLWYVSVPVSSLIRWAAMVLESAPAASNQSASGVRLMFLGKAPRTG